MSLEDKILSNSDEIFQLLLDHRAKHPDFKFWLRSRESTRSNDKSRLQRGYWFQGNGYIFVSFHNGSGGLNMTRSIGWVMTFDKEGSPRYNIEIVWPDETDNNKIATYKRIIQTIGGFQRASETKYYKYLPDEDRDESLLGFIDSILPTINRIIEEDNTQSLFIPDDKFKKQLDGVMRIREALKNPTADKQNEEKMITNQHALNTILYGPPGTGKTYSTIEKAISIINPNFDFKDKSRSDIKVEYDRLVNNGQIVFTTFHQSLSYEDFIEGIKPKVLKDQVIYEVQDGIFKDICNAAYELDGNFDEVLANFKNDISEPEGKEPKLIEAPSTHFLVVYRGTNVFYVQPKNTIKENPWYPVNISNIRKAFETDIYTGIYNPTYVREIISHLVKQYKLTKGSVKADKNKDRYVLIIDEINRGNIAQIFGELITLIEVGKRKGQGECIELTLPYSKELFSVPNNVYIIGTMNTADRSIEALDTALRRRFSFEEMLPKPELLSPQRMMWQFWWDEKRLEWLDVEYINREEDIVAFLGVSDTNNELAFKKTVWEPMLKEGMREHQISSFNNWNFSGVNLEKMLVAINNRLNLLLDKDHAIGHAWFMKVRSLGDLNMVFIDSIIPLLQEFFYNDFGKIGLVIGESFVQQVVSVKNTNDVFAKFNGMDNDTKRELLSKPLYKIRMPDDADIMNAYKLIYTPLQSLE